MAGHMRVLPSSSPADCTGHMLAPRGISGTPGALSAPALVGGGGGSQRAAQSQGTELLLLGRHYRSPPAATSGWGSPQGCLSLPWYPAIAAQRQKATLIWGHSLHQSPLYLKSSSRAQLGWEEDLKDPRDLHSHFCLAELA